MVDTLRTNRTSFGAALQTKRSDCRTGLSQYCNIHPRVHGNRRPAESLKPRRLALLKITLISGTEGISWWCARQAETRGTCQEHKYGRPRRVLGSQQPLSANKADERVSA